MSAAIFWRQVGLVVVRNDLRHDEHDQFALANVGVARAEQPADQLEIFEVGHASEIADVLPLSKTANGDRLLDWQS